MPTRTATVTRGLPGATVAVVRDRCLVRRSAQHEAIDPATWQRLAGEHRHLARIESIAPDATFLSWSEGCFVLERAGGAAANDVFELGAAVSGANLIFNDNGSFVTVGSVAQ